MTWSEYFSDCLGGLLLHLVAMAALSLFLLATGTEAGVLFLILLTWLLGLFSVRTMVFFRQKGHLREVEAVFDGLDQKHLFAECAPNPKGAYERHVFELLHRSGRAMVGAVSDAQAAQREYREYIDGWVHEIKTPITAAQLICRNADAAIRRKLLSELGQIENHVERVLFYARAESPERDFVVRKVILSDIVSQALAQHQALLIQNGVSVEMDGLDCVVYTDEKWTAFMVGQLLQNAARYRREAQPLIRISARTMGQQVQMTVSDNGVGIPAHELVRIFDRGFTGSNGRAHSASTGMGLYLCRRLAEFLQIDVTARSVAGEGTDLMLTFSTQQKLSKL